MTLKMETSREIKGGWALALDGHIWCDRYGLEIHRECQKVKNQCRCPGPKTTIWKVCKDCLLKKQNVTSKERQERKN